MGSKRGWGGHALWGLGAQRLPEQPAALGGIAKNPAPLAAFWFPSSKPMSAWKMSSEDDRKFTGGERAFCPECDDAALLASTPPTKFCMQAISISASS